MNKIVKERVTYVLFVSGALIFFLVFIIYPMLMGFCYSFTDFDGIKTDISFVGLKNYLAVFSNKAFKDSIGFTVKYAIVTLLASNVTGFLLAMIVNSGLKTKSFLRTVFFLPNVISLVTVGFLWNFIASKLIPQIGELLGIEFLQRNLLAKGESAFGLICLVAVWQGVGYIMLIYLAGLQKVPADMLEASAIDGANRWQRIWYIILPSIRSSAGICIFLTLVNGLKVYDLPYALTAGGPYGATQSIAYNIYMEAFTRGNYPLATAESFIFCIVVGIVAVMQMRLVNGKES